MELEQITKALMLHSQAEMPCLRECPYSNLHYCGAEMAKDALSLINELTEENESLRDTLKMYRKYNKALKAERADTVREFAERLKYTLCIDNEENTETFDYAYTLETIDQIAKEMMEG